MGELAALKRQRAEKRAESRELAKQERILRRRRTRVMHAAISHLYGSVLVKLASLSGSQTVEPGRPIVVTP